MRQAELMAKATGVPLNALVVLPPSDQTEYGSPEAVRLIADAAVLEVANCALRSPI
jgi:hypothetical protein